MSQYDHQTIEKKWQEFWFKNQTFKALNDSDKEKYYVLDMFPYPSGAGLHVGHPLGYTATDIISRKKRHQGFNVLHPMGWDAFGLPAENYAIKTGVHPAISTNKNENNFRRQIQALGFSYDWEREFSTTEPDYYRWSQWIFLQLYKKGLAYEKAMPMNWCPSCKIVAANEEVEDGHHERCGALVEKKNLRQWMFRITDYAERLLTDLDTTTVHLLHGWGGGGKQGWFQSVFDFCQEHKLNVKTLDFPETDNPEYLDWKTHFDAQAKFWPQDTVIAHSLGSSFMLRYLTEEDVRLDHLILVAPCCGEASEIVEIANFDEVDLDWEKIKTAVNKITILGSDDDEFMQLSDFELLARNLDVPLTLISSRGHFSQSSVEVVPEVLDLLQPAALNVLDWPDKIKAMQRNWIGKSIGAEVDFEVEGFDKKITVYTTRIDTIFSGTFIVMAPEHDWVDKLTTSENKQAVEQYKKDVAVKSDIDRTEMSKGKTGAFTGRYAVNPATGDRMPIWIADFVLASYGTGVVFADAHDERDFVMAKEFDIPLKISLLPENESEQESVRKFETCFSQKGILINSAQFDGLHSDEAMPQIIDWLADKGSAREKINYKLRDWIFTRQRYWGEPIPLVFDEAGECYPLADSELPLVLPETPNYEPSETGESPLAKIEDWVNVRGDVQTDGTVKISTNGQTEFRRETSTMPNWAGSSWYWLRFMDPKNEQEFCSKKSQQYWGPVDLYVGGAEHAVLHLLYARFWHKTLFDLGLVTTREPFKKLVNQGLIMAEDGTKMSKSIGNVINPDDIVETYGADSLRCYEMFMGPFDQNKAWSMSSVGGIRKWLDRVVRVYEKKISDDLLKNNKSLNSLFHKTIKQVGNNIDDFKFNTAISQLMVLTNELTGMDKVPREALKNFALLLSPFAPHLAEELWQEFLENNQTIAYEPWPDYDQQYLVEDTITYGIQVNGKVRGELTIASGAGKDEVLAAAKQVEKVAEYLRAGMIRKEIFVPGKIIGFVVN